VIAPFVRQVELLDTVPGIDRRAAEAIIAEIGVDVGRFGHSARLASWGGVCPGQHQSAGRRKTGKTRKGSTWLRTHLNEAAKAASRSKGTYLAAQYARLKPRRGHAKATVAVEHSLLVSAFHILDRDVPYADLGAGLVPAPQRPRLPRRPNTRPRLRRHRHRHHTRSLRSRLGRAAAPTQPQEEARLVLSLQLLSRTVPVSDGAVPSAATVISAGSPAATTVAGQNAGRTSR
jgi:Transposase IS116/IS110/IS902 family